MYNNTKKRTVQTSSELIEEENDSLTDELSKKVHALKHVSIEIGNEAKRQNGFLNDMGNVFDSTEGFLQATMRRVTFMASSGHNKFIWCLLFFCLFVFVLIWIIIKTR